LRVLHRPNSLALATAWFLIALVVGIPSVTWTVGAFLSAGAAVYFVLNVNIGYRAGIGYALALVAIMASAGFVWLLLHPSSDSLFITPASRITEIKRSNAPRPSTLSGSFVRGSSATFATSIGVARTDDDGATWTILGEGHGGSISSAYFVGPLHGWRLGSTTATTHDGGRTWSTQLDTSSIAMAFDQSYTNGWIGAAEESNAANFVSADGGSSWRKCPGSEFPIVKARFTQRLLIGVAINGDFMKSADSGCTWQVAGRITRQDYYADLYFLNEREGWITDFYSGHLLHTTDGGAHFDVVAVGDNPAYVFFSDSNTGWVISEVKGARILRKTADAGQTWQIVAIDDSLPPEWTEGLLYNMLAQQAMTARNRRIGGTQKSNYD
jgi:hypothetical protein